MCLDGWESIRTIYIYSMKVSIKCLSANSFSYLEILDSQIGTFSIKKVPNLGVHNFKSQIWDLYCKHCLWSIFGPCLCTKSCKTTFYAHLSRIWKLTGFTHFIRKVLQQKSCYPESLRFLWLWPWYSSENNFLECTLKSSSFSKWLFQQHFLEALPFSKFD